MTKEPRGIFVTGTDTGVGKTEIACGLIRAFAANGHRVIGMKPVAAGARSIDGELRNGDVEQLRRASTIKMPRRAINPYIFAAAVAPHLAAESTGVRIELRSIARAFMQIARHADVVVVEGIGGFLVPLSSRNDTGDLAQCLRLPVLLVVGMRVGCLSHALLTVAAIAERGLTLAGWVANRVDPAMRAYRGNVHALQARLSAPLLGEIAYRSRPAQRRLAIDRVLKTAASSSALQHLHEIGRAHNS